MSDDYQDHINYCGDNENVSQMRHEGLKRSAADDGDSGKPVKRLCRGEGPRVELRVLLQSKNAGAIIGKGGSNIKRLRTDYNASVTVPDSSSPERILTISADLGTVCECLQDVIPTLEDYKQFKGIHDFDCEIRVLVHQSQAGCVIGRAGFKIKELRESTGTNIKVYSQVCPRSTDRIVQIQGPVSKVVTAVGVIFELLQQAPPKGPVSNYDPHNCDEFSAGEYGGFTSSDRGGSRGASGGGGGGYGPSRGASRGDSIGMASSLMSGPGFGNPGTFGPGFGGDSLFNEPGGANVQSTQVSIPKDLAGAIIGKGGSRIQQVRQQSMASITIAEALPGSNERIITITGSPEQIQNAKYLLQLSVKQHANNY